MSIPNVEIDNETIVDNIGALEFSETPEKLGVIGSGVIGLELGSVWSRLGSQVMLFEALDEFLPALDKDVSRLAAREFKKQKLDIHLGARVSKAEVNDGKGTVNMEAKKDQQSETYDELPAAVGG